MTDLSTPLQWDPAASGGVDLRLDALPGAETGHDAFRWPAPPYASYPPPQPLIDPMPCEIVGVNGNRMTGRLTFFMPEQAVANVQIPPSRTTLPLRFDQFRCLTLTTPLLPLPPQPGDPHAAVLAQRAATPFRLIWAQGQPWSGETIGHAETPLGLFLFLPLDEGEASSGTVRRLFVPAAAFRSFELGPRIGDVLVEQHSATPAQIEEAARTQQRLRDQKLGDILVTRQVVTPEQLLAALEAQAKMPMVRIGEALLQMGMVTKPQLDDALLQQQSDRSVPLGELLVRSGVVSRADLQTALARKMGYPLVDIDAFPVEAEALRKLPYAVAAKLLVMPLLVRDGRLIVALDDPVRRRGAITEVEMHSQMKAAPVLAQSKAIEETLFAAYDKLGITAGQRIEPEAALAEALATVDTDKLVETLEREDNDGEGFDGDIDKPIEQSDNSLVRLINNMIIEAHREGVSDIHIESYPGKQKIRIRFRKDGLLRTYLELPPNYRAALIARIKIMCDLDISERRKPQDGKINFAKFSPQHKIELRVASIPTNSGLEDVVMRILASAKPIPLDRLGMSDHNLKQLKLAVERPYGMVLCVGPTGSGKTTTLHSALAHINVPERKIWTAEDPIEITQPGLRQVQVNPKIDWTFAKALRAFLRADPDAIMVGEIRDGETAQMAVEASLTGHLVLSTLHTNSAPETVTRLLDMGMDPFNFADSLLAVLAQRLVRRLCAACRVSRPATDEEASELLDDFLNAFNHGEGEARGAPPRDGLLATWIGRHGKDGRLQTHHSAGCDKCEKSGFKGRAGLHELMVISRELRHLVQTGARAEALQKTALAEGMRTLRQDGIEKVLAGVTSIEEVRSMSNS